MKILFLFILIPFAALFISEALTVRLFRKFPKFFESHKLKIGFLWFGIKDLISFGVWVLVCSGCYWLAGWIL